MNRLKTVEVHKRNGVELGTPEVTTYDYTKVGSRASISLPNGITTSYQYDSLNRLTNLTHKKADTLIASYTYNLLLAGRRSAVTEVTPEGTSQINYAYDNLYRLTNETRTGVNPFTASYAYDINSNRTQKVETVNGITETINYEYNANDQLLSEVSSANGTTVYTYDVNGSLTNKANEGKFSYQYGYDLRNRLATANVTRKEGTVDVTITSSYAYNANGIRTRALQTINGITQNRYFLLDDGHTGYAQVFEETAELGGSIVRSYTIGDDVLSQTVAGVTSHLLYDGHGSTRQLTDNNGAVTANYAYDAYGKMLGGDPGVTDGKQSATDLLYAGEQFDPGLQMEYLRARYYDQDNGRFNRLDPFEGNSEDPQSLHKYAYCHVDPVNGIDPSGNMFEGLYLYLQMATVNFMTTYGVYSSAIVTINAIAFYKAVQVFAEGYDPDTGEKAGLFTYAFAAFDLVPIPLPWGKVFKYGKNVLSGGGKQIAALGTEQLAHVTGKKFAQTAGEVGASYAAREYGLLETGFKPLYHGFDNVYFMMREGVERFVIIEAKGGTARLDKGQMSQKWILKNIQKLIGQTKDVTQQELGLKLLDAFNNKQLDGMLVTTKIKDGIIQDPVVILKELKDIGLESF